MKNPQLISNELVVFYDCDDTLVMWDVPNHPYDLMTFEDQHTHKKEDIVGVKDPYASKPEEDPIYIYLRKHNKHIKLLADHKARGYTVIVWSAGGFAWAQEVVNALQLNNFVDMIMSKPKLFVDDLPAEEILVNRIYLSSQGSKENE